MKAIRLLPLLTLATAAAAFTGCTEAYDTDKPGMGAHTEPAHNFLGIVKYSPNSYTAISPTTIGLRTDEIYARRDSSGDCVSLFWGLVTITDN